MSKLLRQKLNKNKLFHKLVDYASKTGFIDIDIDACERWNRQEPYETPKIDGTFDVEGHNSVDVNAFYYIYPSRNLDDLLALGRSVLSWIKYSWEFKSWSYSKETWPFTRRWGQWLFVVDSFQGSRYEIAEKTPQAKQLSRRGDYKTYGKLLSATIPTVTDNQIHHHLLDTGHFMVEPGFYISEHDPMCMVFNEKYYPYDLKDGWSNRYVTALLIKYFATAGIHVNIREGKKMSYQNDNINIKRFDMWVERNNDSKS